MVAWPSSRPLRFRLDARRLPRGSPPSATATSARSRSGITTTAPSHAEQAKRRRCSPSYESQTNSSRSSGQTSCGEETRSASYTEG